MAFCIGIEYTHGNVSYSENNVQWHPRHPDQPEQEESGNRRTAQPGPGQQSMGCGASQEAGSPPPVALGRRASASAQGGINPSMVLSLSSLPKIVKSEVTRARIVACIDKNVLCRTMSREYRTALVDSMREVKASKGHTLIKQGDIGDFWYVVDVGAFEARKQYDGQEEPQKVKDYASGDSFGELALMFNHRRAASVVAVEDSVAWAVDQASFRALVLTAASANQSTYM